MEIEFEEKNLSTEELLDIREKETYLELGRTSDPEKRKQLLNEAKIYSEIRNANEQTENNRLNNNSRNDVEERKVFVEEQRLKVEKKRVKVDCVKIGVAITLLPILNILSYNMDTLFPKDNRLQDTLKKLNEWLTMRK